MKRLVIAIALGVFLFAGIPVMGGDTIRGTVKEMDRDVIGVTIVTPQGETITLVAEPDEVEGFKEGDLVEIHVEEEGHVDAIRKLD